MVLNSDNSTVNILKRFSDFAGILIAFIGVMVIVGWAFDISVLKSPGTGFSTIKSNVGLAFIFIGISLWLQQSTRINIRYRRIAQILAAITAIIGFLTIAEYLLNINLGIDQILFKESPGAINTSSPNRMSIISAFNLVLAGIALILMDNKSSRNLAQYLSLMGGIITSIVLIGYLYSSPFLYYPLANYTGIALYASLTFTLVFVAILSAHPTSGFMNMLTNRKLGGYLSRRLLPPVIILPVLLGWLWITGQKLGLYNPALGVALYTILVIIILTSVLWFTSNSINLIDDKRMKTRKELNQLNSYNRSLIEANLDLLFIIDPNGIITDVNKSTENITGYSREKLVGTNFSNYFKKPEKARAVYQKVFQRGFVLDYPLDIKGPGEITTPVLYNASLYRNEKEEVLGVLASARDVSKLKKAEYELKKYRDNLEKLVEVRTKELDQSNQSLKDEVKNHLKTEKEMEKLMEELKRSNNELQQFAYVASHDLQEPLRMVTSFTQLLEKRYKDQLDNDANDFIKFIVDGAKRMQNLIDDLLTYSRVTRTEAEEFKKLDMEDLINEIISNLIVLIEENDAEITHDILPCIRADKSQIIQLFQNLIGNAIKFHGEETPKIHISSYEEGDNWIFEVEDNGIGIESHHQERIFRVFQRLNKREDYPGTGIGLSVCEKIVQHHNGRIWIESEPGKGSKFFFTLPK
jgi:PAS domain S-box-containing protein